MSGAREPVDRAIDVLVWLSEHPASSWGVRPVARALDTSPATIHRVFRIFERRGLLTRDVDGRYSAGLELFRVCESLVRQSSPTTLARPLLVELCEKCGESVLLAAYDAHRGEMMFIEMVQAEHPLRYVVEIGRWLPLHAGATGLAILAYLPEDERASVYAHGIPPVTHETLTSEKIIEKRLEAVRALGYCITSGERTPGAVGIAAPVFDCAGDVYGDVCVTVPASRYDEARESELVTLLLATCDAVTATLRGAGFRRSGSVRRA